MKRKLFYLLLMLVVSISVNAQQSQPKFDPAKFEADLQQYIITEAGLCQSETQQFLPVYKEMRGKQKNLHDQMRSYRKTDLKNEKACEEAIRQQDRIDMEMKELQQAYHQKFMKILPASKVLKVIKAEERFHRQAFKRAAKRK